MFLTDLKINGFKSFANKTELKFSNGVTCIIGPNGCGKSNIVDAIRWVIGEQRAGSLRSDKMMDVIFNGNKKRKPLGFSEVTLTILNDKGVLPAEYSEIQITRRLFRSGQSEYLLNNNVCRLKDIQDLFMDTGMGSDAYSVIELKMIEQILSSNNEDRRVLLEEAAGIKKYKQRRKSALRKLNDTRQNLVRIQDILKEVQNSVRSLSRQVEKAKKYREYKQRLQELELQTAAYNYTNFMEKIEPIQNELNEVKMVQQDSNNQLSLDESLSEKIKFELLEVEQELGKKRQEIFGIDERLRAINEEELILKEKRNNSEQLIKRLTQENEQFIERKGNANLVIEEKRKALESVQDELDSFENQYNQSEDDYNTAVAEYASRQKKLEENEQALRDVQRSINQTYQRLEQLNFQAQQFEERLDKIEVSDQSENQKLNDENETLKSSLKKQHEETETIRQNLQQLDQDRQASIAKRDESKQEVQYAERDLISLRSKKSFLEETLLSGELLPKDIKAFQEKATEFKGFVGLLSDLISISDQHEKRLSHRLQQLASLPVFRSLSESELKTLKSDFPNLRLLLLPDSVQQQKLDEHSIAHMIESDIISKDEINALFGNILFLEKQQDLSMYRDQPFYIMTPYGDYSYYDRSFKIISSDEPEFLLLDAKKDVEKLTKQIDDLAKKHEQLRSDFESSEMQIKEYEVKTDDARKLLNQALQSENEIQSKISQNQYQIDYIENEIKTKQDEIASLTKRISETKDEHAKRYPEYESMLQDEKEKQSEFDSFKQLTSEKSEALNQIRDQHNELKLRRNDLIQNEQNLKEILKREYYFLKDVDDKISANQKEVTSLGEQIKEFTAQSEGIQEQIKTLSLDREQKQGEKLSVEEVYQNKKMKIDEIESEIKSVQKRREDYQNKVQKLELKLNEYQIKSQTIHERIYNEYKIDIKTLKAPEEFKLLKTENEIFNIKNSLINLGEVNSLAIEEFEKENERLTFLTGQYNDLVESEDMLVETIDTINQTAKDKFDDVFSRIRDNFIKVFLNFFPNGEADLVVLDSEDPLDGKIDIKVSPKGKSLQTLSLMSGGEKTLTAISLLFAIYLVKPSPFCILDEVDAPLDDVNISRFTQAIRMFTDNTQFIIITHNKRTMEAADYMYGVTQEEEGVSKLVSVNFGQV